MQVRVLGMNFSWLTVLVVVLIISGCSSSTTRSAPTVPATRTGSGTSTASAPSSASGVNRARPALPRDSRAEEWFATAERYLNQRNYADAARLFLQAAQREPAHRVSTASWFLAGRAEQLAGNPDVALAHYQELLRRFPDTRYTDDAQYHKGLILLAKPGQEAAGLYLLLNLAENSTFGQIKQEADNAARDFLYRQASLASLQDYLTKVRAAYRATTVEALVLRARQENKPSIASQALRDYQTAGNELTPRLRSLQGGSATTATVASGPSGTLTRDGRFVKIAVLLPFQSARPDSTRDVTAQFSMELLAGIQTALNAEQYPGIAQVELRAFDTAGDSIGIMRNVAGPLAEYAPDLVIGDIRNRPSRAIARLAQQHNFVQLIPLSDTDELAPAGSTVFQANPTETTTARGLAGYVGLRLAPRKVMVLDDNSGSGGPKARMFEQTLKAPGIEVRRWPVSHYQDQGVKDIRAAIREVEADRFDAIYAPLSQETHVSFLMYQLGADSVDVRVIGTDQWRAHRNVDRDLYRKFQVIINDAYQPANDTVAAAQASEAYLKQFMVPPTQYAIQGYDLVRHVLFAWGRQPSLSLADALRQARRFRGIAQDFWYNGKQSNQSVQVLQYQESDLIRLDAW